MISRLTIEKALPFIRKHIPNPTPVTFSPFFSEMLETGIFIKWDNKLRTGSFKERGVINFLSRLSSAEKKGGVIASSAGNHAIALAYYAQKFGISCDVVMPTWAPLVKVRAAEKYKAKTDLRGSSFQEANTIATERAKNEKKILVPPYNDERIIDGQGSIGIELIESGIPVDAVIVPVGGGGLIAGIATYVKEHSPQIKVIGVQSEWVVDVRNGKIGHGPFPPSSIADGIAVKTIGSLTEPIIKKYVDEIITVTEEEIALAIIKILELEKTVIEGAGAAPMAALLAGKIPDLPKRIAVITCGSNIDMDLMQRLIVRDLVGRGRCSRITLSVPDRPGSLFYITETLASAGANIVDISHDRFFTDKPGDVSVSILLELRDTDHKTSILKTLREKKLQIMEVD